jgi:hypothetical protein
MTHSGLSGASVTRRQMLGALGTATAGLTIMTPLGRLTPTQARAQATPITSFSPEQTATLDAFGDVLVPGAAEAGLSHYIDAQLASAAPLLVYKYLDVPIPAMAFYSGGLDALDELSQIRFSKAFSDLPAEDATGLVVELVTGKATEWQGPPAALFYFVIRLDAVDVVYGTVEGFSTLNIPYVAHIEPPTPW